MNKDKLTLVQGQKRTAIQINNRQFRDVIADTWIAIHAHNQESKKLFRREKTLVQIGTERGLLTIMPLKTDESFGMLFRIADWYRLGRNDEVIPTKPPRDCAKDILVYPDKMLPRLDSIISTPIFTETGGLISSPGYYEDLGVYMEDKDQLNIPSLPKIIGETDVADARNFIFGELLSDFPFVSQSDRAHAVAALIQPFIRPYFQGCSPMFLIEAACPGTGKGLLTNVISIIVTGNPAESRTLPNTEDEVRKMLTSELSRGRQIIVLDNADVGEGATKIHSPPLACALTSKIWTDRILGESRMISIPNKALWIMTGNNPQLTSELARRSVRIRIDAKTKSPWLRNGFRHTNLELWALENRGKLIYAILLLIQYWLNTGGERYSQDRLGSFEDWSGVVGGILKQNGIEGFLGNLGDLYQDSDAESREWELFVELWSEKNQGKPSRVQQLNGICEEADLLEDIRGNGSAKSQHTKLGVALRKARGRVFGTFQIELAVDRKKHGKFYRLIDIGKEDLVQQDLPNVLNGSQGYPSSNEADPSAWNGENLI